MRHFLKMCAVALCLCLTAAALSGCGAAPEAAAPEELNVYATVYPIYAIADMILKDVPDARLNCLVQPQDGCLRGYALSDWDLALLSGGADAVIAGGRGLESFASTLYALGDLGPAVSEVLYNMELVEQEAVNAQGDEDAGHWEGGNPHIYMSVDGAAEIARRIAANLAVLDPEYEELYMKNLEAAEGRLESLAEAMGREAGELQGAKVAVLNEALVYVARAYDMEIALCWARESGEEVEGAALEALLEQLQACGAQAVLIEKQAPRALLDALEGAGVAVAALDTLSTRRADEGAEGYFNAQLENARSLRRALSGGDSTVSGGSE